MYGKVRFLLFSEDNSSLPEWIFAFSYIKKTEKTKYYQIAAFWLFDLAVCNIAIIRGVGGS